MQLDQTLPVLLTLAWLLPLGSFALILFFGPRMGAAGRLAGALATSAICGSMVLSVLALLIWSGHGGLEAVDMHHGHEDHAHVASADGDHAAADPADEAHEGEEHPAEGKAKSEGEAKAGSENEAGESEEHAHADGEDHGDAESHDAASADHPETYRRSIGGSWYNLAVFGKLKLQVSYYIDGLTVLMFAMVTVIATCIHFYAIGYMHDELHDVDDHEVHMKSGGHLHRPGRFHRFFQYLSLFCFSMLGLVISGNILLVFVFWELVGICSYFLIGFYFERKSASNAANKAFIVNRVGDFGMLIGLMALWSSLGTFSFFNTGEGEPGIFELVRPKEHAHELMVPAGMAASAAEHGAMDADHPGYGLLIIAGIGIFCGCIGKSAQFPLHVWLPDAMEGPTPVSALVHSATMVAAGVYLVGRFYPVFAAEVLIVIAYTGAITLFLAASIAITATDIKRVLAYSTVSQLGYMMLALGVGGWLAGMFHLVTHAFFKSLLFMCSGSVIHACHTNEMTKMGGLRHKMPWTAYTMLVGCLAIAGAGLPLVDFGLSGYYSKDSIIAHALLFRQENPHHAILFWAPLVGAAITSFYMFRLWFMTFAGPPKDQHVYDHAHESPKVMYVPLVVLAVFAIGVGWNVPITGHSMTNLLEQARPAGEPPAALAWTVTIPDEHDSHAHEIHLPASLAAISTAAAGFVLALMFYGLGKLNPQDVRRQFPATYQFLIEKWRFDELYDWMFMRPVHVVSGWIATFDRVVIDGLINGLARWTVAVARFDDRVDRGVVDGLVNWLALRTYRFALGLRQMQTGLLRQYVMFIVVGTVGLFVLLSLLWSYAQAAPVR